MNRIAPLLLFVLACHKPTHVDQPAPPPSLDSICALVDGRLAQWNGIPELALDAGPACLGPPVGNGIDERFGFRHFVAYKPAQAEVRILGLPTEASVVEVVPSTPLDATVLATLPPAEARVHRSEGIDELVYGVRGLALLVAKSADGTERITRVRGFKPMSPALYEQKLGPHQRLGFP